MTDAQLVRFVSEFRRGILRRRKSRGRCGMVCYPLSTYLSLHGVEAELVITDLMEDMTTAAANHAWLLLPDGRVLDPTIDQFNTAERRFPKVYLGDPVPGV